MRPVIGPEVEQASPETDVVVHQDVGSAFCDEFGCGDSGHVRTAADTIHDKEDVRLSSGFCSKLSTLTEMSGLLGKGIGRTA